MGIGANIVELLQALGTGIVSFVVAIFKGITGIFYTEAVGETPGGFTLIGVFLMIALVVFFIIFAIKFITGLVKNSK